MKTKLAFAVLAALWIHSEVTCEINRRRVNHNGEILLYLATRLDESGVQYTEFDKIVMTNFTNQKP